MPEKIILNFKKNFLVQYKVCFLSALIVGLIAHLYKITNWLPNWDSLVFRYDIQDMLSMGRCFLSIVCAPGSFYDLPMIAGLLAIIFHGLGAVCICKMFNVKKGITAALIGGLVAAFPTVTSVMMYNYVADGYAIAFLLSCIAAMLATKEKPSYVGAAILIGLSTGIYQAYVTVTIMLILLDVILNIVNNSSDFKKSFLKVIKLLITGVSGMIIYYVSLTVLLKITGTELINYQGFDSAASFKGIDIAKSLYVVKELFVNYFFGLSAGLSVFFVLNVVVFLLIAIFYVREIIKNKLNVSKLLLLLFCVIMLPIGAGVLAFINADIDYHNLMKMGFLVFYLFLILQYEKLDFNSERLNVLKSWTILGAVTLLIFDYVIIANVSYHKLNMAYEKSYGILIRIADRIEQTEGANDCDSVLVLGSLKDSESYSVNLPPEITGTTDGLIIRADDEVVGQSVLCSALNDYCAKDYKFLSGKEKAQLLENIDLDNVSNWPEKNSIFVVNDVIVIKLSD